MIGATASVGAASATRAWLGTRNWRWLTSLRLRAITIALIVLALLGSATLKGSTPAPRAHGHRAEARSGEVARVPATLTARQRA
jgi:hypothetical protein